LAAAVFGGIVRMQKAYSRIGILKTLSESGTLLERGKILPLKG